jgi:hypothetical protein
MTSADGTEIARQSMGVAMTDINFASRLRMNAAEAHPEGRSAYAPPGIRDEKASVDLSQARERHVATQDPQGVIAGEVDAVSPGAAEVLLRDPVGSLSRAIRGM